MADDPRTSLVVIGQGYVGLPLAMLSVENGMLVLGVDTDERRVSRISAGDSPVEDVPNATIEAAQASGSYAIANSYDAITNFDVAVVTVPTPLHDAEPDLSFLESACSSLAPKIRSGSTIVIESTTYPGTTQELIAPLLDKGSGLRAGKDFALGFSPERIDPGNTVWTLKNTPKVVSGINDWSLQKVQEFYDSIVDTTVSVPTPKEAELSKLLENTFRHVNIALVNELLIVAKELDIDIWSTIDAAATKPFGFMRFMPGPGVGGHCLPVDPTYLSWEAKRRSGRSMHFIELANEVNNQMPRYVVQRVSLLLNDEGKPTKGSRLLVLGLSYKKNTSDLRESPAMQVVEGLLDLGADVHAADPKVDLALVPAGVTATKLTADAVEQADLIVLLTDHDDFDYRLLGEAKVPVLDTRRRLNKDIAPTVRFL